MWNDHPPRARHGLHLGFIALGVASLCAACNDAPHARRAAKPEPSTPPAQAAPAPTPPPATDLNPAELKSVDATSLFDDMRKAGKRGTVVNVWASWCGSCKAELPMLLKLRDAFASEGLDFVFVSADEQPGFDKAVELMREWAGPLPVLVVTGKFTPFKRALHPTWKGAIPATFLFDDKQQRRHFWEGPVMEHEISPILQGYLAGEPIDGETRPALAGGHE